MDIILESSWATVLKDELSQPYFNDIIDFIEKEQTSGKKIYPSDENIFKAFNNTPFDNVKVVILGQDPYHNPNEAMGLSFSVPKSIKTPPSLKNIYKELADDLDIPIASFGDLTKWSNEGVFLLNAMLTVEHKKPGSHRKIGWQQFTDAVIKNLSDQREGLVFLLWGNFAKSKATLIDADRHLILQAAHPSPLARGAFFGCKHFSKTNAFLLEKGIPAIDWSLEKTLFN